MSHAIADVTTQGVKKIRSNPQAWKGDGMAIAGIVTGAVGVLRSVVAIFSTVDEALRGRLGGWR